MVLARAITFAPLKNPFSISEDQLDAIKDTSFKDQENKPLGETLLLQILKQLMQRVRMLLITNIKLFRQVEEATRTKIIDSFVQSRATRYD